MKLKKLMAAGFITAALTLMMSMNAFAFGWQMTNGRWWYGTNGNNTTWLANQWMLIDGYWYYFDQSGWMAQNQWIGDYYVGNSGAMLTNTWTPDGYWVGADGKWVRNGSSGSGSTTQKEYKWTGSYSILNSKTEIWGTQFYGHDYMSASGSKIKIKGYFYEDDSNYMGYHEKTFKVDENTNFFGAGGNDDPHDMEKAEFFKMLNKNSGLQLTLEVEDDYVTEATLSS